jgi:Winged helix DNA-binding domain
VAIDRLFKLVMTKAEIIRYRLFNQQIAETKFTTPKQILEWMVAMQAQEYAMAKWAIGLRLPGSTDEMVEKAFTKGELLRTHLMRPTWHFVTPEDIRWLLKLTAPRVDALNAFTYRQQELDSKIFRRSNDIISQTLEGGKHLLRTELQKALKQKKIVAEGVRLSALMMKAELDGIICSGPRRGNQFTYALLDERVTAVKAISRKESLALFAKRYFTSRGPATLKDFATWSGLSISEAKEGVASLPSAFVKEKINGQDYFFIPASFATTKIQSSFLMPDYDEYGMSYKDRSVILNPAVDLSRFKGENPIFNRMIIINGKIDGTWKRSIKNNKVVIETVPFGRLPKFKQRILNKAIKAYGVFVDKEIE